MVIAGAKKSDEEEYSVVVKNEYGETTSNTFRLTVIIQEKPLTIISSKLEFGNFIITVEGKTDGLKVMYSSDLKSKFKEVSLVAKLGDKEFLIPASAPELQGPKGFFRVKAE